MNACETRARTRGSVLPGLTRLIRPVVTPYTFLTVKFVLVVIRQVAQICCDGGCICPHIRNVGRHISARHPGETAYTVCGYSIAHILCVQRQRTALRRCLYQRPPAFALSALLLWTCKLT
jgi:hypothetical protein